MDVSVDTIIKKYNEIRAIADEVKKVDKLIGKLKKLLTLFKASVDRLPNRNPSQGVLEEIYNSFADIEEFMSIYKGQGWFSKWIWWRKKNKSTAKGIIEKLYQLNNLLQTDLMADILQCHEAQRKFRDDVLNKLSDKQETGQLEHTKKELARLRKKLEHERIADVSWKVEKKQITFSRNERGQKNELGRGGFGVVMLGEYQGMPVAVKQLNVRFKSGDKKSNQEMDKFQKEVSLAVELRHDSVVRVYGGSLDPEPFLVMECCSMGSLHEVISNDDEYNVQDIHRLTWSKQLSSGLVFLHHNKILHHDIKSMNVLLDKFGQAKWSDFGMASKHTSSSFTESMYGGSTGGTEKWSPPEAFKGK